MTIYQARRVVEADFSLYVRTDYCIVRIPGTAGAEMRRHHTPCIDFADAVVVHVGHVHLVERVQHNAVRVKQLLLAIPGVH